MSYDVSGLGSGAVADIQQALASLATPRADQSPAATDSAVQIDLSGASDGSAEQLPAGLQSAFETASQAYQDLQSDGIYMHFSAAERGGVQVELQDEDGNAIGRVDPTDVLRVASGESLF